MPTYGYDAEKDNTQRGTGGAAAFGAPWARQI